MSMIKAENLAFEYIRRDEEGNVEDIIRESLSKRCERGGCVFLQDMTMRTVKKGAKRRKQKYFCFLPLYSLKALKKCGTIHRNE